jgi:galactokinase
MFLHRLINLFTLLLLHVYKSNAFTMSLSPPMTTKLEEASKLYRQHFSDKSKPMSIAVAPGRVNLIGEHTDYTGGFVLPFAIDYSTVVYGSGSLSTASSKDTKSRPRASIRFVSSNSPNTVSEFVITQDSSPPKEIDWTTYVVGTVFQYLADLPKASSELDLTFVISGDVPLGSGLSSSASLEVSVARFVETILGDHAFSSEEGGADSVLPSKVRALRCQKAENEWCQSPCGIMDQYVSSAAKRGSLLLIDCTSLEYQETKMIQADNDNTNSMPVLVVANSNVQHDIAGGEYPVRVAQCKTATQALERLNPNITSLRAASSEDVEQAKDLMDEISYKRAKHVVSENDRTLQAKKALEQGDWALVGELMNASHASMREDYEVSCEEIDVLVDIAQKYPGVYGSRLTGGGFGGCTVTMVAREKASGLISQLKSDYKSKTGKDCFCFETQPAMGAHVLSIDSFDISL